MERQVDDKLQPGLRVLMRFDSLDKAFASAKRSVAKYGPKFAIVKDVDFENGGGTAYPFAVVTPYAYPYTTRGK
jgi:hypothetical protein